MIEQTDSAEAARILNTLAELLESVGWRAVCMVIGQADDEGTTIGISTLLSGSAVKALIDELDKQKKGEVVH